VMYQIFEAFIISEIILNSNRHEGIKHDTWIRKKDNFIHIMHFQENALLGASVPKNNGFSTVFDSSGSVRLSDYCVREIKNFSFLSVLWQWYCLLHKKEVHIFRSTLTTSHYDFHWKSCHKLSHFWLVFRMYQVSLLAGTSVILRSFRF
jgi:hypothetical protein